MRLRCSKGMRIATFHGHLFVRSNDLVALPSLSSDDTIVAQMTVRFLINILWCVYREISGHSGSFGQSWGFGSFQAGFGCRWRTA